MTLGTATATGLGVGLVFGGIGSLLIHQPSFFVIVMIACVAYAMLLHAQIPTERSLAIRLVINCLILLALQFWTNTTLATSPKSLVEPVPREARSQ